MPNKFLSRVKHAWNAFMNRDPPSRGDDYRNGSYMRPDRPRVTRGKDRTIITSVYNKIAIDCARINIRHVRLDSEERYTETINSTLNNCLTLEANKDQTARAFIQDIVLSMLDEGSVAIVPVDVDRSPVRKNSYNILTMRTAKIVEWFPNSVRLRLYNDRKGLHEEIILPKKAVAIIENPLFAVMNETNSTLQRLIHKLSLLDAVDEQSSAGKLDLIIQLPYAVKSPARKAMAEERKQDIADQLENSQYGIAYVDSTEKITQLNRSLENNLMGQIEYLTAMLYSQLGITKEILEGTAGEQAMLDYTNRTIEPILSAIVDELKRKFLTQTARTQGQSIMFFRDPFRLVPISQLAEAADKLTRNEIMSSNDFRQIIGLKPSETERAEELRNKNIPDKDINGMRNNNIEEDENYTSGYDEDPIDDTQGINEDYESYYQE